jgi:RNA polymerase I-specific transcription initiation factor RRN3
MSLRALVSGPLMAILTHKRLSPLQVCLPSVVHEFTAQAHALGLMDPQCLASAHSPNMSSGSDSTTYISTPRPNAGAVAVAAAAAAGGGSLQPHQRTHRPLEMFFPFDPYLLPNSAHHLDLDHSYRCWQKAKAADVDGNVEGGATGEGLEGSGSEEEEELDGISMDGTLNGASDGDVGAASEEEGEDEELSGSEGLSESDMSDEEEGRGGGFRPHMGLEGSSPGILGSSPLPSRPRSRMRPNPVSSMSITHSGFKPGR